MGENTNSNNFIAQATSSNITTLRADELKLESLICHSVTSPLTDAPKPMENGAKNEIKFENGLIKMRAQEIYPYPGTTTIMSDIEDVKVFKKEDGCPLAVKVFFADGTSETAVRDMWDEFSLDSAIGICVAKKLLSDRSQGHGSSLFNKIVKHGVKIHFKSLEDAEKKAQEERDAKARYERVKAKKAKKRERKEAAAREDYIEMQKEAYIRALKEVHNNS